MVNELDRRVRASRAMIMSHVVHEWQSTPNRGKSWTVNLPCETETESETIL